MEYFGITKEELLSKLPRLYRFVSINDTLELFESKSLSFRNPSQWKDPFESFYLSKQYQIKDKNNKKKALTENLVTVMKTNKIDCFDINGGALVYKTSKVKKPINGKSLLAALKNYYKTDPQVAEDLAKHVLDSREEQIKETIKRKIDK